MSVYFYPDVAAATPAAKASSAPKIEEVKVTRAGGEGADGTPKIKISIRVSGLKADEKYSVYLGDTPRDAGDKIQPGKTEWVQGEKTKEFSGAELAKGVELTAWCAKGPKYVTVADFNDTVVAPSQKIRVE